MSFQSINPYTEITTASFPFANTEEAERKLTAAQFAFLQWRTQSIAQRAEPIAKLATLLRRDATTLAEIATSEMGKLCTHAKAEVLKSATVCDYVCAEAHQVLAPSVQQIETGSSIQQSFEPLGVIFGIFPWNFPYWQILRSAIPILMSGNTILVKPAPNVPQSALALQQLVEEAGFPFGTYQTIFADNPLCEHLIADDRIAGVTLTGSEQAGSAVAAQAAKHIKPQVLELGGSDPLIVLEDAAIGSTIEQAVFARFQNNGQSCVAAKRFIVHQSLFDAFTEALIHATKQLQVGDPMDAQTNLGPLARKDLQLRLTQQVEQSVQVGAKVIYQHAASPKQGYFYPPTILGSIPKDCPAYNEELFGPVISLFSFSTLEEAIALANDTRYGLGASIYTADKEKAQQMASALNCGMVYINQLVKSDARFPFGGIKKSGYGRELGELGLKAFCQVKTVWVKD